MPSFFTDAEKNKFKRDIAHKHIEKNKDFYTKVTTATSAVGVAILCSLLTNDYRFLASLVGAGVGAYLGNKSAPEVLKKAEDIMAANFVEVEEKQYVVAAYAYR